MWFLVRKLQGSDAEGFNVWACCWLEFRVTDVAVIGCVPKVDCDEEAGKQ